MISCGSKKIFQKTSSGSSFSLNTWLLRLKNGAKPVSRNARRKWKTNPVSPMDDGFYWKISFDEEKEVILENSDYQLNVSPVTSRSFKKTVSNGRKMSEFIGEEGGFEGIRRKASKDQKSRKAKVGSLEEKLVFESKFDEDCVKSTVDHSRTRRIKLDLNMEEEWRKLKSMKINEIMLKSEKQRKFVDVSKETRRKKSKQRRSKVNVFSPRIKAFEDMKRTRMKMKRENAVNDAFRTGFDSFAIVKSSFDPKRDFRDSMIEMIIENGIREREEFEELLACYLILNCDEYHHLIIKVFQQVWLELNHFDPYFLTFEN